MKKILLTCAVFAMTIFATEAQTKKTTKKKKAVSSESRLNSDIAKIKSEKRKAMEEQRMERLYNDSVRIEEEKLDEMTKDSLRMAWKEQKLKEVDSTNNATWKQTIEEKESWYATERSQTAINKAAKINDNQGRLIKQINMTYNQKSKAVRDNMDLTDEDKRAQLMALNTERREKIKAIIGSKKEEKLEKARKEYSAKNKEDINSQWMNEYEVAKKSKKNK
jgi:hypothetical protein